MANGRATYKRHSARFEGRFIGLPLDVVDSPAYLGLSYPARALLVEIARQYVGDNNGRLLVSAKVLAKRGWTSADVITRAKKALLEAQFIFETVKGHRPNKASWYALTWRPLDRHKGFDPGVDMLFRRGAYRALPLAEPKASRDELYSKWRGTGENAEPIPAHGAEASRIAPSRDCGSTTLGPPDGAVRARSH